MRRYILLLWLLLPATVLAQSAPDTLWLVDGRRVLGQMRLEVHPRTQAVLITASTGEAFAPSFVSAFTMGARRFRTHLTTRGSDWDVHLVERASQGVMDLYAPLKQPGQPTHFEAPDGRLWPLSADALAPFVEEDAAGRTLVRQARTARTAGATLLVLGSIATALAALDGARRLDGPSTSGSHSVMPALALGVTGGVSLVVGHRLRDRHGRLLRQAVFTFGGDVEP